MLIGATVYALEIPNYFTWIDRRVATEKPLKRAAQRTALAMAYFNPLWIARHLLFIKLASLDLDAVNWELLELATKSFVFNVPVALIANYIIQIRLPLEWRFVGSAIFSALMAVYYALADVFFGG